MPPVVQLEVLNTLERNDPDSQWHCVHLQEWFDYRSHVCMVSFPSPDDSHVHGGLHGSLADV